MKQSTPKLESDQSDADSGVYEGEGDDGGPVTPPPPVHNFNDGNDMEVEDYVIGMYSITVSGIFFIPFWLLFKCVS